MISIQQPELLRIRGLSGRSWGVDQAWYLDPWQREAGCDAATCANMIWYLARRHTANPVLWPDDNDHRTNLIRLMEETWHCITPTHMGVHRTSLFADGAAKFGDDRHVLLDTHVLDISPDGKNRPSKDEIREYLSDAFASDLPVAFLNLDSGALYNLESWHWVTLIAMDERSMKCQMLDQGRKSLIDLGQWLDTTGSGGGFVVLEPGV